MQATEPSLPPHGRADPADELGPGHLSGQVRHARRREQVGQQDGGKDESQGDVPAAENGPDETEVSCAHRPMLGLRRTRDNVAVRVS